MKLNVCVRLLAQPREHYACVRTIVSGGLDAIWQRGQEASYLTPHAPMKVQKMPNKQINSGRRTSRGSWPMHKYNTMENVDGIRRMAIVAEANDEWAPVNWKKKSQAMAKNHEWSALHLHVVQYRKLHVIVCFGSLIIAIDMETDALAQRHNDAPIQLDVRCTSYTTNGTHNN